MSIIIFAGTSPLATLELFGQHAPIVIIVLTGLIYSASLAPHFKGLSVLWKGPLAYLLADQAYAVSIVSYNKGLNKGVQHWYFLGAALTVRVVWLCGTAAGAFLGAQIPASWSLDFTIPLSFLSLLLPSIKDKPSVIAAISAGTIALIARDLPFNIGIFLLPWPVY
jgi:predicted branched-subunit amino acid permease